MFLTVFFIHKEQPNLFPPGAFNFDNYLWSQLIVTTRAFAIGEDNDWSLIPLADMINHDPTTRGGNVNGNQQFELGSTKSYAPGEDVFVSYGPKTNFDLLASYGFLLDNNPANGASLETGFNPKSNILHSIIEPLLQTRG